MALEEAMLRSVDCETTLIQGLGDKIRTYHHVPECVCVSYAFDGVADVASLETPEKRAAMRLVLKRWLDSDDDLVFHNAAFDVAVLSKAFDLEKEFRAKLSRRQILDTRVLYSLRYPDGDGSRSLAAAADRVLGIPLSKDSVRLSFNVGVPLTPAQRAYAIEDARVTLLLAQALLRMDYGELSTRPENIELFKVHADLRPGPDPDRMFSAAAAWLAFMIEPIGLGVAPETLREMLLEQEGLQEQMLRQLADEGLAELVRTPRAPVERAEAEAVAAGSKWEPDAKNMRMLRKRKGGVEQVAATWKLPQTQLRGEFARAAQALGLGPGRAGAVPLEGEYPVSATGGLSLDYKFWRQYREELPEKLQAYLRLGKAQKLVGTYLRPLLSAGAARVHPHIGVAFAETARWTCWRPNMANQPKSIRRLYVPREGHVFVSADYKSLELYCAAEAFDRLGLGGGPLRRILDAGGDVHRNTASLLFRKAAEDIEYNERQAAKVANFSLLGGLGTKKFWRLALTAGLQWTLDYADEVRTRWFSSMTDCAAFVRLFRVDPWDACPTGFRRTAWLDIHGIPHQPWPSRWDLQRALNNGAVYEIRLPSGRVVANRTFSQAANIFFQGIGAEVISEAFNLCGEADLDVAMVVHDSVTIDAPEATASAAADALAKAMQEAQKRVCSCGVVIPVPEVEIGKVWS